MSPFGLSTRFSTACGADGRHSREVHPLTYFNFSQIRNFGFVIKLAQLELYFAFFSAFLVMTGETCFGNEPEILGTCRFA